ncbi:MAG: ABC transporter permease [Acidaminococcales bacterium]|jgi:putative ABC transport system permease protein|nr:ABC transporter permease [Acidaminococcales bacterium]
MWPLIFKNLLHRKLQNVSLALSVAAGVAILFCALNITKGVDDGLRLLTERMGADIIVVPGGVETEHSMYLFSGATVNRYMPADTVANLARIPGVVRASQQFFTHTLAADCHDIGNENRMLGYDPASDWIVGPWLKKINKVALADDEVILGAGVPTWTQDKISVLGKWYKIVAVAEKTGASLDKSLFVSMNEARRVARESPMLAPVWQKEGDPAGLISTVLLKTAPKADINLIVERIQNEGYFKPIVAAQVKEQIINQFTVLVLLLAGTGAIAALCAIFHLFARFYSMIIERQAEWGLYMALGASAGDLSRLVLGEAATITACGALLGLPLGGILYLGGLAVLESYQHFPFAQPSLAFMAIAAAEFTLGVFVFSMLSAWLPALRLNHVEPGVVMTRGEFD